MSDETLGHDVNGEALRAGDRVEPAVSQSDVIESAHHLRGFTLSGELHNNGDGERLVFVERDADGDEIGGFADALRKLQSGRDVFNQARDRALSEGNPDAQHEWTEPTTSRWAQAVLAGMPWTEPSQ